MQYLVGGMLIIIASLVFGVVHLASAKAKLEYALNDTKAELQLQNDQIEQLKLDSEKYHCDIDSLNQYTRDKYKNVKDSASLETCEAKMAEFEKMLGIYNETNK